MIHIIQDKAVPAQIQEMLEMLQTYIKLAGDISLINIRPRQNNPSMEILDAAIREQITAIVVKRLGNI